MQLPRLIAAELLHRKANAMLALVALATAVTLFVGFTTLGAAMDRETTRLMRDLGFNLRIIPKAADETEFWRTGYAAETMPEDYIQRFGETKGLSYRHLVATLQQWVPHGGAQALLTGIAPEVSPPDAQKKPMIFEVAPGRVYLGHQIAQRSGLAVGDSLELLGESFLIDEVLSESGSDRDVRVYANIADAQRLLGLEGRINEIKALECLCRDPNIESIDKLRMELAKLMPDAHVIQLSDKAKARERQRLTGERYFALVMQFVLMVCAVWVGVLAWLNVRERRYEIGVFRALGYGGGFIAGLFLGKAVLLGLLAAGIGFACGTALALGVGPGIFEGTAGSIAPDYAALRMAGLVTPAFAALCSMIPAALAVAEDPAVVLRND